MNFEIKYWQAKYYISYCQIKLVKMIPSPEESLLFKKYFYFLSAPLISIPFRNILLCVLMQIKIIGFRHTSAFPVLRLAYSVYVLLVSSTH